MANESSVSFRQALKMKRLTMRPQDRKRVKSMPRWIYPKAKENLYFKRIKEVILDPLKEEVNKTLKLNLESWIEEKQINDEHQRIIDGASTTRGKQIIIDSIEGSVFKMKKDKLLRKDQWLNEVQQFVNRLFNISKNSMGEPGEEPKQFEFGEVLLIIAASVYLFGNNQWKKQTESILGYEFRTTDPWWADIKDEWIVENISLIKNVSDEYRSKIQEIITRGIRNGSSINEILRETKEAGIKTYNRAKLIARDQIGKLNGQITKYKMTEVGLNIYEWLTAMDERVRGNPSGLYPKAVPSHFIMNNKLCRWDDDSIYAEQSNPKKWMLRTGKMPLSIPGEEIQCRCTAAPYINELIDEIDQEIEEAA